MIADFFKDLTAIDGVEGIVVYGKDNSILDSWADSQFNTRIFEDLAINYLQIFLLRDNIGSDFREVVLNFEKSQVYVRDLTDFIIVVIAKNKVEISLLRIVINVGYSGLASSRKMKKIFKKLKLEIGGYLGREYLDDVEEEYLVRMNSGGNDG